MNFAAEGADEDGDRHRYHHFHFHSGATIRETRTNLVLLVVDRGKTNVSNLRSVSSALPTGLELPLLSFVQSRASLSWKLPSVTVADFRSTYFL